MAFNTLIQQTVYDALAGNISAGVYDDVPFLPEGEPRADFPYVTIGYDTSRPWDNDSFVGQEVSTSLHVWSRASGMKEAKGIMDEIYDIMNRAEFTAAGYMFVDCLYTYSNVWVENDLRTRHGVINFLLTVQKTS